MALILNERLILADGTILEDSSCGYVNHELHCWIRNKSLSEAFEMFSNPDNTKVIRYQYRTTTWTYNDFTDLFLIRKMEDYIDVRLTGGTNGGIENDENEAE